VVGLVIIAIAQFVSDDRFSALAFLVLAGLTLALAPRLGAVQHPLNAINSSPSNAIRAYYTAIWIVSLVMGGLLVIWLQDRFASAYKRST
jgi:preprotein translocase subunit SecY